MLLPFCDADTVIAARAARGDPVRRRAEEASSGYNVPPKVNRRRRPGFPLALRRDCEAIGRIIWHLDKLHSGAVICRFLHSWNLQDESRVFSWKIRIEPHVCVPRAL